MPLTSDITDYDQTSPSKFNAEKVLLRRELGDIVDEIHHVGSTSIVGIKAKPEIDLLIIVKSISPTDPINTGMANLGYDVRGECGMLSRHYFSKNVNGKEGYIRGIIQKAVIEGYGL